MTRSRRTWLAALTVAGGIAGAVIAAMVSGGAIVAVGAGLGFAAGSVVTGLLTTTSPRDPPRREFVLGGPVVT